MKRLLKSFWGRVGLVFLCVLLFLLGTSVGSVFLIRSAIRFLLGPQAVAISRVEGSLLSGLCLTDLETSRIPKAPEGSRLVVRQLLAGFSIFKPVHPLTVVVRNARLRLPESETLLASGRYENGLLGFNLYARLADVPEIMRFFMSEEDARPFSGTILQADLNWLGKWRRPVLRGNYFVQDLNYQDFSLRNAPGHVDIQFFRNPGRFSSEGELYVQSGELKLKNCVVTLAPSRLIYRPNQPYPDLDLAGHTVIQGLTINMTMKGSWRYPDLRLASDPPFPQEHLLLMVATGRRWKGMETTGLSSGNQLSLDMVGDFIDFVAFGGAGGQMAQQYGIEGSLVLSDDGRTRELGVRKSLTENMGVRYGLEQSQSDTVAPTDSSTLATRHKIGADLQITETDQISVEAESQLSSQEEQDPAFVKKGQEPDKGEKVVVKYKKRF